MQDVSAASDPMEVSHPSEQGSPVLETASSNLSLLSAAAVDETVREDDDNVKEVPTPKDKEGSITAERSSSSSKAKEEAIVVGGSLDKAAYCLLDGMLIEDDDGDDDSRTAAKRQRITLPITLLPATLGRTHNTTDPSFLGMGKVKALSRQHFRIEYRTKWNGLLSSEDDDGDRLQYSVDKIKRDVQSQQPLPESGFFAVTCLGKNRIVVDGQRVDQGETALLMSGSTLRVSTYSLYFLLPNTTEKKTMEVPGPATKKRKPSAAAPAAATTPLTKKSKIAQCTWPNLQAILDSMSVDELLEELHVAIDNDSWDRRYQLLGSTLSYRAVLAAAQSPQLQAQDKEKGGVPRADIITWIEEDETFGPWQEIMLTKLEEKSYRTSITKALLRASYNRTGTHGRYIRWNLPSVSPGPNVSGSLKQDNKVTTVQSRKSSGMGVGQQEKDSNKTPSSETKTTREAALGSEQASDKDENKQESSGGQAVSNKQEAASSDEDEDRTDSAVDVL